MAGCNNELDERDKTIMEYNEKTRIEREENERNNEELVEESNVEETDDLDEINGEIDDVNLTVDEAEIRSIIRSRVSEQYEDTSILDIRVNEDLGSDEGYIVLVDLSFDRQNSAGTSKEMVDMYASDLAAHIAEETDDVNEMVSFWEVPYLQGSGNIIKITTERTDDGMAFVERWYEPSIFE